MKFTEIEASKKFSFDEVPCQKFDTKNISVEVGRLEFFGAENFLFKNRASSFVFKVVDAAISFAVKKFLRQNFIGVANVVSADKNYFVLRIVFFCQAVRFNTLPILLNDKARIIFEKFGSGLNNLETFTKNFQFDDGVSENCFSFVLVPTKKILILQAKNFILLVRIEQFLKNSRAVIEGIFSESYEEIISDFGLQIGYGKIEFTTSTKIFPQRLEEILFAVPSYIKIWNEYAELEGDFLLNRARAVGEISCKSNAKINGDRITLNLIIDGNFDLTFISAGDFLEVRSSPPAYIKDSSMTWQDYLENFAEVERTDLRFEVFKKSATSITLLSSDTPFPKKIEKLYYSISGSEVQIERRKAARERIEQGKSAMKNLGMILGSRLEKNLCGLGLTFQNRQKNIPLSAHVREKIFSAEPTLNQVQAIDIAINTPDIAIIQGPPGTGKTTVIAAILERLNELADKNNLQAGQVLVTSLQHDAVQNIIDKLNLNSLPTIKFGRGADKTVAETVSTWREEILKNLDKKISDADKIQNPVTEKISEIVKDFRNELEKNSEEADREIFSYNFAFAATAQQSDRFEIKRLKKSEQLEYDTVIIDEAARITPGDLMIPMSQAAHKIILVGDHRQLPHLYDEEIFSELRERGIIKNDSDIKTSMFEQLWNRALELEQADGIKRRITLDSQFRMHPILGKFISENFYEVHGEGFNSPRPDSDFAQKICRSPVRWINIKSKHGKDFRAPNFSLYRPYEALYIVNELQKIFSDSRNDNLTFGVISFYRAQVQSIKREINLLDEEVIKKFDARVKIGTVDEFQGMEFDVMFLSVVRACRKFDEVDLEKLENPPPESDEVAFAEYKKFVRSVGVKFYGFLTDNRLCVALSRQKKLLIVVGESAMFNGKISARVAKICVPAIYNLLQLCKEERSLIDV